MLSRFHIENRNMADGQTDRIAISISRVGVSANTRKNQTNA